MKLHSSIARLTFTAAAMLTGLFGFSPEAQAGPGQEALAEFQGDFKEKNVVQNRFFLKEKRFELAPVLGYVPNNPMVKRYVGGVLLGYHFSETLGAGAQLLYSPDLGEDDLKGLAKTLVNIAASGESNVQFQQPIDKMTLGATFSANWAPVYGKINLIGERVINFDLYGVLGLGLLSINEYYAQYDEEKEKQGITPSTTLTTPVAKSRVPFNVGVGMDFFLGGSVALKIDARNYLYIDKKPDYDPDTVDPEESESRLYNNFIASVGVGIYFPRMKPRQYDF